MDEGSTATAILGIKIEFDTIPLLKKMVKKPAFSHNFPEDFIYHPKTGKKLWLDDTQVITTDYRKYVFEDKVYDDDDDDDIYYNRNPDGIYEQYFTDDGRLTSKCLCRFIDHDISCYVNIYVDENEYWIGIIADHTNSEKGRNEDFEEVPSNLEYKLKTILEPHGLWNKENYGLWALLSYSV